MWVTVVVFGYFALSVHGHSAQKRQAFQNGGQAFQTNEIRGGLQRRQLQPPGAQRQFGGLDGQPRPLKQPPFVQEQSRSLLSQRQQPQQQSRPPQQQGQLLQQRPPNLLQPPQQPQIFQQPPSVRRQQFIPFVNQIPQAQQQQLNGQQRRGNGFQNQRQSSFLPDPFPTSQQQRNFGLQPQSFGFEQKPRSGSLQQQPFIQGFGDFQPQQHLNMPMMHQRRPGQGFNRNRGPSIRNGPQQVFQQQTTTSPVTTQSPTPPPQQETQAPQVQPLQDPPVQPQQAAESPAQEQQAQVPPPQAQQPADQPAEQVPPPVASQPQPQDQQPVPPAQPQETAPQPPRVGTAPQSDPRVEPQAPPSSESAPAAPLPPPQDTAPNSGPPSPPSPPAPPGERRQRDAPQGTLDDSPQLPRPLIHVEGELSPLRERERLLSRLNVTGVQPAADDFVQKLKDLSEARKVDPFPNNPNDPLNNLVNSEIDLAVNNWIINEEIAGELALTFGIARESAGRTMILTPADLDEVEIHGNNPTAAKRFKVQIQELLWRKIDQQYRVTTDLLADLSDAFLGLLAGNGIVRERFADDVAAYFVSGYHVPIYF